MIKESTSIHKAIILSFILIKLISSKNNIQQLYNTCFTCLYNCKQCTWKKSQCIQKNEQKEEKYWFSKYYKCEQDSIYNKEISELCIINKINNQELSFIINNNSFQKDQYICKWYFDTTQNNVSVHIKFRKSNESIYANDDYCLIVSYNNNTIIHNYLNQSNFNIIYNNFNFIYLYFINKRKKSTFPFSINLLFNAKIIYNTINNQNTNNLLNRSVVIIILSCFGIICISICFFIFCVNKKYIKFINKNHRHNIHNNINNNDTSITRKATNTKDTSSSNNKIYIDKKSEVNTRKYYKSFCYFEHICNICNQKITAKNSFKNSCGHMFHYNCINNYIINMNNKCNICNIEIDEIINNIDNPNIIAIKSRNTMKSKNKKNKRYENKIRIENVI